MNNNYRYLGIISTFFVVVLIVSNIASTKIIGWQWLAFDGGTLLFPFSYIFGDILTEVYGYKQSRRVIWLGFGSAILMSLMLMMVGALPPAPGWENQSAYEKILGLTPRLVIASLLAYLIGSFSNSIILAKLKVWTNGRWLWLRTIGSTVVGEFLDSVIFVVLAFGGILSWPLIGAVILSNYFLKTAIEIIFTPITYRLVNFLKRQEGEDYYDKATNFNPFGGLKRILFKS
jgi:hypothetical protein